MAIELGLGLSRFAAVLIKNDLVDEMKEIKLVMTHTNTNRVR
jgi:hypothetical protein